MTVNLLKHLQPSRYVLVSFYFLILTFHFISCRPLKLYLEKEGHIKNFRNVKERYSGRVSGNEINDFPANFL